MTASELQVRAWVEDVWDTVVIAAAPDWTVARVKAEAVRAATEVEANPDGYQVKLHGALVLDENRSLSDLGVTNRTTFTVLSARRRPFFP
jgi:hypothetical protein